MLGLRQRVAASETVVYAELDDEIVLLNVESGIYFGLDVVGARIWTLLAEGMNEEEMCERLQDEFAVDARELRADLAEFLDLLVARGLAWRVGGG
jgi:hypothetical protein